MLFAMPINKERSINYDHIKIWLQKQNHIVLYVYDLKNLDRVVSNCDALLISTNATYCISFFKAFYERNKPILVFKDGMELISKYLHANIQYKRKINRKHKIFFPTSSLLKKYCPNEIESNTNIISFFNKEIKIEAIYKDGSIEIFSYNNNILVLSYDPSLLKEDNILFYFDMLLLRI